MQFSFVTLFRTISVINFQFWVCLTVAKICMYTESTEILKRSHETTITLSFGLIYSSLAMVNLSTIIKSPYLVSPIPKVYA